MNKRLFDFCFSIVFSDFSYRLTIKLWKKFHILLYLVAIEECITIYQRKTIYAIAKIITNYGNGRNRSRTKCEKIQK